MTIRKTLASAAAITALLQASVAQAQEICVEPADLSDTVVYAVPGLMQGLQNKCSAVLSQTGFVLGQSGEWVTSYDLLKDETWPGTRRFFLVFANGETESPLPMDDLPDTVLRPLLDLMLPELVMKDVKVADCEKIERTVELLSPLPPENTGGLVALMLEFAGRDNPPICGVNVGPEEG